MVFNFLLKDDVERAVKFSVYEECIPEEVDKLVVYSLECSVDDLASWIQSGRLRIRLERMGEQDEGSN